MKLLAEELGPDDPAVILSTPWLDAQDRLHNSVVVLEAGQIAAVRHKVHLPNYGVFDELRLFRSGPLPDVVNIRGVRWRAGL